MPPPSKRCGLNTTVPLAIAPRRCGSAQPVVVPRSRARMVTDWAPRFAARSGVLSSAVAWAMMTSSRGSDGRGELASGEGGGSRPNQEGVGLVQASAA